MVNDRAVAVRAGSEADVCAALRRGRGTQTDITTHVLSVLPDVGTELVIIDDVHFLDLSAQEGRVVNDHLKYIAGETAATFVYTGVNLKKSGLFLEGQADSRATQTSGRNTSTPSANPDARLRGTSSNGRRPSKFWRTPSCSTGTSPDSW